MKEKLKGVRFCAERHVKYAETLPFVEFLGEGSLWLQTIFPPGRHAAANIRRVAVRLSDRDGNFGK